LATYPTLDAWLEAQQAVHPKSIDLGLARVTKVARALGVDKARCPVLTVGGTNGKGSVVAHSDALLRAAGLSTGVFTSPHLVRYNERICINGVEATDAELISAFDRIEAARGDTTLTYFEFNALAALLLFADRQVDVAILEVGLGGRLDAVNLLDADVAVVASIGLDHRDWLGDTLEAIGREKAGIFRAGRPAVLGTPDMPASIFEAIDTLGAKAVVAEKNFSWTVHANGAVAPAGAADHASAASAASAADASAAGNASAVAPAGAHGAASATGANAHATTSSVTWNYQGLGISLEALPPSALSGAIQFRNASTALAAVESLGFGQRLTKAVVSHALRAVKLPGRFHTIPGPVEWILDVAHNEPAARVFADHLAAHPSNGRTLAVVAILGDKDSPAIAKLLHPLVDRWIICTIHEPRGLPAAELARRMKEGAGLADSDIQLATSVEEGFAAAKAQAVPGDRVIVCGGFNIVGSAIRWLRL
jgi:dihydrofolate synthase/folylpolyglutamate synthase